DIFHDRKIVRDLMPSIFPSFHSSLILFLSSFQSFTLPKVQLNNKCPAPGVHPKNEKFTSPYVRNSKNSSSFEKLTRLLYSMIKQPFSSSNFPVKTSDGIFPLFSIS